MFDNKKKKEKVTLNGTISKYGGRFSAHSIAVIPKDQISTLNFKIRIQKSLKKN